MRRELSTEKTPDEIVVEHEQYSGAVMALKGEIDGLTKAKQAIEAKIKAKEDEFVEKIENVNQLNAHIDDLGEKKKKENEKHAELAKKTAELENKKESAKSVLLNEIGEKEEQVGFLKTEIATLKMKRDDMITKYDAMEKERTASIAQLDAEILSKQEEIKKNLDLEVKRDQLLHEISVLEGNKALCEKKTTLAEDKLIESSRAVETAIQARKQAERDLEVANKMLLDTSAYVSDRKEKIEQVDQMLSEKTFALSVISDRLENVKRQKEIDSALKMM